MTPGIPPSVMPGGMYPPPFSPYMDYHMPPPHHYGYPPHGYPSPMMPPPPYPPSPMIPPGSYHPGSIPPPTMHGSPGVPN